MRSSRVLEFKSVRVQEFQRQRRRVKTRSIRKSNLFENFESKCLTAGWVSYSLGRHEIVVFLPGTRALSNQISIVKKGESRR